MAANVVRVVARNGAGLLAAVLALLLAMTLLQTGAEAKHEEGHVPANKVAVAASEEKVFGPGGAETPGTGSDEELLMRTHMRNPASKALQISVTLECSITTELFTQGTATAEADGRVEVWIEIHEEDGTSRRVTVSDADQSEGEVTFCNQKFRRTTDFQNDEAHSIDTFLRTKSAAAFNWIDLHPRQGVKVIEVWARLTHETDTEFDDDNGADADATALAVVGNRTLVVEPIDTALGEEKTEDDVPENEGGLSLP